MTRRQSHSKMTLFIGAGLSLDSGLPTGAALGSLALELVANRNTTVLKHGELARVHKGVENLRLEIVLERLGAEISSGLLFEVFELLVDARPNLNHLMAVTLTPTILTTNQDMLLEESAKLLSVKRQIIHLHGRCDNKQSIITMISQYLAGLRPSIAAKFRNAVLKSNVVVLGYSGRDSDVMSILGESKMKTLTWIQHPGSSSSPELIRLRRQLGDRLQLVKADAKEWLAKKLSHNVVEELKHIEQGFHSSVRRSDKSKRQSKLQRLSSFESNLAVGRLIEHLSWYDLGLKLYSRLLRLSRARLVNKEMETRIQLAIGRVLTYQYKFESASTRYLKIARDVSVKLEQRCEAFVGCIFALRNASHFNRATRILAEFEALLLTAPANRLFYKFRGEALGARAGMLRIEGEATESVELYKRANRCFRHARDVDGWLDVSTWLGDNLIMLGRFKEASDHLRETIDETEAYGRYFSRAWPLFLWGEVLGFSGDLQNGLKLIEQAKQIFDSVNNPQGQVYCWLYISDIVRERSLDDAEVALRRAQRILQKHDFAYAHARFLLEVAELARARDRSREMYKHLGLLEDLMSNRLKFLRPPALFAAHARSIRSEYSRQKDQDDKFALMQKARQSYEEINAQHGVTRIAVSHWLATRNSVIRKRLISISRNEGYGLELKSLTRPAKGYYALHFA
jgi:tetratricopeptide (TPR) repeat protein